MARGYIPDSPQGYCARGTTILGCRPVPCALNATHQPKTLVVVADSRSNALGPGQEPESISPVEMLNVLLRYRRLILGLSLLTSVGVVAWAVSRPITFKSSAAFLPMAPNSRPASQGAALARQLGFGLDGGGQSEVFVQVVKSRELLRKAVETTYEVSTDEGQKSASLVTLYGGEEGGLVPPWLRATKVLRAALAVEPDAEGVMKLELTGFPPHLGEQILRRLLTLLDEFNQENRRNAAQQELRFVSERLTAAQTELTAAENRLRDFLRSNREWQGSPDLLFEHGRLERQVEMRQQLYLSLAQGYEQSRVEAIRDTPLLTIIDAPEGATEPVPRRAPLLAIVGGLLGALIAVTIASLREFSRRSAAQAEDAMREFARLKAEAWLDLRHPTRLLRRQRSVRSADAMQA